MIISLYAFQQKKPKESKNNLVCIISAYHNKYDSIVLTYFLKIKLGLLKWCIPLSNHTHFGKSIVKVKEL
jgi:hypothetical protein